MSKSILKTLPKLDIIDRNTEIDSEPSQENISLKHTHRDDLIIKQKSNYSYEELLVYLNTLDSLWEKRNELKSNKNFDNYIN